MMAIALEELARALREPAGPPTWPVVNTPAIQAMLDRRAAQSGGRPSPIKPHQVVRLVRFVRLGQSLRAAAARAGVPERTARRILSGQAQIAHHPAVTAAGVFLPAADARRNPGETRQRPDRIAPATQVAAPPAEAPTAPISAPDREAAF